MANWYITANGQLNDWLPTAQRDCNHHSMAICFRVRTSSKTRGSHFLYPVSHSGLPLRRLTKTFNDNSKWWRWRQWCFRVHKPAGDQRNSGKPRSRHSGQQGVQRLSSLYIEDVFARWLLSSSCHDQRLQMSVYTQLLRRNVRARRQQMYSEYVSIMAYFYYSLKPG